MQRHGDATFHLPSSRAARDRRLGAFPAPASGRRIPAAANSVKLGLIYRCVSSLKAIADRLLPPAARQERELLSRFAAAVDQFHCHLIRAGEEAELSIPRSQANGGRDASVRVRRTDGFSRKPLELGQFRALSTTGWLKRGAVIWLPLALQISKFAPSYLVKVTQFVGVSS